MSDNAAEGAPGAPGWREALAKRTSVRAVPGLNAKMGCPAAPQADDQFRCSSERRNYLAPPPPPKPPPPPMENPPPPPLPLEEGEVAAIAEDRVLATARSSASAKLTVEWKP